MLDKQERLGLMVYLHYNRDVRKVAKLGDVLYHSKKLRYVVLYVNQEDAQATKELLEGEKYVKKVLPSYQKELDKDFVGILYREERLSL